MSDARIKTWAKEATVMLMLVLIAAPLACAVIFALALPIVGFWWMVFRFVTTGGMPS